MTELDAKIHTHFPGLVVRKDLVKTVKGNAIVPSYVLEYLLGQYCASNDSMTIEAGIETVKEILRKHYVHRNESELIRSHIREKGRHKVIDKISVTLNDREDVYEAEFSNLGIKKLSVAPDIIKKHPKLLVSGVWCIADVEYAFSAESKGIPWILSSIKPIQLSSFDMDAYLEAREHFSLQEWIDLFIQSMGFNPATLSDRNKLLQLVRLIPFCERNYNLMELGPKGTGKSHIYSEFSPHGILISGGEVTIPKLFVNNASGRIGLVGYWDCVAFDEFAGKQKQADKSLVDILKNYMANKSFSRGVETLGAEASMVFVGNTQQSVLHMLTHSDLFCELPDKYHDSAFLDRIHFYIPGWEVDIIRGEMFSDAYGFVVDYLAEVLRCLRSLDFSERYKEYFTLSSDISTRDRDAIHKTFSGLMKLLFPHGRVSEADIEKILQFSIEGRKRVKDQLMRIDGTYSTVHFSYNNEVGQNIVVTTFEEDEYPLAYHRETQEIMQRTQVPSSPAKVHNAPQEGHIAYAENCHGVSYDILFGMYVKDAIKIIITDPYLRLFYQLRNFMEFLETVLKHKKMDMRVAVHLITLEDELRADAQIDSLTKIQRASRTQDLDLTWEFDANHNIHARHIVVDNRWKISLDRGLDIFQAYVSV